MPNWNEVHNEISGAPSKFDNVRRKYLSKLHEHTDRNVIAYYSGWLQDPSGVLPQSVYLISDTDVGSFMATISGLDRSKGLDLILHTPGGDLSATEALVNYLHNMFDDIRAIIPQLSLSAGTMLALSADSLVMGKHSSLGPIDPQVGGRPAHGIIEEFKEAEEELSNQPTAKGKLLASIVQKYGPTLIGECEKAIEWSEELVNEWLRNRMFEDEDDIDEKIETVIEEFGDHALTKSHNRHISISSAEDSGLHIERLEDDQDFQDIVLSVHHAFQQTFTNTDSVKITENQQEIAHIQRANISS